MNEKVVLVGAGSAMFTRGLVADIMFLDPIGLRTALYLAIGYFSGRYTEAAAMPGAWAIMVLTGVVSLISQTVYGVFQYLVGTGAGFLTMLRIQILPAAVLDALLSVPVFAVLTRIRLLPPAESLDPTFR